MATATISEEETSVSSDDSEGTLICLPCKDEGKQLVAVGYCVNCREYLCHRCFEGHLIPSVTKKHLLLDKDHLAELEKYDSKYMCAKHTDEEVKYYCSTHTFLGCHTCFFKHQKTCKDVVYIPEVSETLTSSEEFKPFNQKLTDLKTKCTELASHIKKQRELIKSNHAEAITNVKQFKQEILDLIDTLEKECIDKAGKAMEIETLKLDQMSNQCNKILTGTIKISNKVETLQNKEQKCGLYLTIQLSKDIISRLEGNIQSLTYEKQIRQIVFRANTDLSEMLKRPRGLGHMNIKGDFEKAEHVQDINIKTANDISTCYNAESVFLPGNKLIITDWNNTSVKLVDTKTNKIISTLDIGEHSWGVCCVDETVVAVTLYYTSKIVLITTAPTLKKQREFGIKGNPRGIGYQDSKLVVSFQCKVEIMDMQGTVISTFDTDNYGHALFNNSYHLAIHPNNKLIYVSNDSIHNVVCIRFDGTVVAAYKDNELRSPSQVTIDSSGNVFVCGYSSKNVHQITENCKKIQVILTEVDGLENPTSISYEENEGKMYIGQYSNDSIKVYKFKYSNV